MPSIFTQIIEGEIPCYRIAEDEKHLAFLDVFPVSKGHVLVVPKAEVDYIFDMSEEDYLDLHIFARKVAVAMGSVFDAPRIGSAVIGLEVPHVHIHLVPISSLDDMDFSKEKLKLDEEEMLSIAEAIARAL